jgi:hypothetical protein
MKLIKKVILTEQEEVILKLLKAPSGVQKTSSDLVRDSKGRLQNEGLQGLLEDLEFRGYLKSGFIIPTGYLVQRMVFALKPTRLKPGVRQLVKLG